MLLVIWFNTYLFPLPFQVQEMINHNICNIVSIILNSVLTSLSSGKRNFPISWVSSSFSEQVQLFFLCIMFFKSLSVSRVPLFCAFFNIVFSLWWFYAYTVLCQTPELMITWPLWQIQQVYNTVYFIEFRLKVQECYHPKAKCYFFQIDWRQSNICCL